MQSYDSLRALLDQQHEFPGPFTFKFIVPSKSLTLADAIFDRFAPDKRPSKKGNYVSYSFETQIEHSEQVIDIYTEASGIPGIMSL